MTTTVIPLTTLPVGERDFGPANAADTETGFTLTLDRTVAGGLNSLISATGIDMRVDQSDDGGTTWHEIVGATLVGGVFADAHGGTYLVSTVSASLTAGTSRRLRARVIVSGTPVAVAGSLVSS